MLFTELFVENALFLFRQRFYERRSLLWTSCSSFVGLTHAKAPASGQMYQRPPGQFGGMYPGVRFWLFVLSFVLLRSCEMSVASHLS